jgi:hypothetical protein
LIPYVRQISLTGRPASASLRIRQSAFVSFDGAWEPPAKVAIGPEDFPLGLSQIGGLTQRQWPHRGVAALEIRLVQLGRCAANSASVLSPLNAAKATWALNAAP